jgi:acyl-coenzyme A thioesterase 13
LQKGKGTVMANWISHVTYIGTAQVGETIEIEATANKVGRSMAFTTIKIYKLVDGAPGPIVCTASHTKYIQQMSRS